MNLRRKRFLTAALALALTAALAAPLPAEAAESSFQDISDPVTAVNADVLRLMGVVDGTGGNLFSPGGKLTRAEFCTMVVNFMQRRDEVPVYATRTIFSDVTASHWGLGYVNLAASINVGTAEAPIFLISGVGDGRFEPDSNITLAQAATILLRVLGYSDEQTGGVWPQTYLNLAASIGLTDGVSAGTYDQITRAQAAQLFVNALGCKDGKGAVYYKSLGQVTEDVILLAVNVTTDDGSSSGAVRTSASGASESYLPANGSGGVYALQGKRGAQVLNDRDELVAFVPDDSDAISITLSGNAQPSYVQGTNGQRYTISGSTPVYTASQSQSKTYQESYTGLSSGIQLTMYSERGKIVAVYANTGSTTVDSDAVVVMGTPSVAMFHQLTGGATDFRIVKNRQPIALSDLQPYDVVTYDQMNNTLVASDLRLTCIYEDASPNAKAPTTITVLKHTFDVLESAWDMTGGLSIGSNITLLLTADGKVAGIAPSSARLRSTAIGTVEGSTATVFLPNGGKLELSGTISSSSSLADQLVTVSSGSRGRISASRLSSRTAPGAFDAVGMKLGGYTVTAGVKLYEQVSGGAMVELGLDQLGLSQVPADKIATYHLNTSDMVDYIVLESVTGNAYTYGILKEGEKPGSGGGMTYSNRTVTVQNSGKNNDHSGTEFITGYAFEDGSFGGVAKGNGKLDGTAKAASVITLTEIKGISSGDFFESQGVSYVSAGGKTYQVSDNVECYKKVSKEWFDQETGAERLSACRAFSNDLTIYVDPIGEQVRIVQAN